MSIVRALKLLPVGLLFRYWVYGFRRVRARWRTLLNSTFETFISTVAPNGINSGSSLLILLHTPMAVIDYPWSSHLGSAAFGVVFLQRFCSPEPRTATPLQPFVPIYLELARI